MSTSFDVNTNYDISVGLYNMRIEHTENLQDIVFCLFGKAV